MNLDKIREILDNPMLTPNEARLNILRVMSEDQAAIYDIMQMLQSERDSNRNLIRDMNLELSRTHVYIEDFENKPQTGKYKSKFTREFVLENVESFYTKYQHKVRNLFNYFNPDDPESNKTKFQEKQ